MSRLFCPAIFLPSVEVVAEGADAVEGEAELVAVEEGEVDFMEEVVVHDHRCLPVRRQALPIWVRLVRM